MYCPQVATVEQTMQLVCGGLALANYKQLTKFALPSIMLVYIADSYDPKTANSFQLFSAVRDVYPDTNDCLQFCLHPVLQVSTQLRHVTDSGRTRITIDRQGSFGRGQNS